MNQQIIERFNFFSAIYRHCDKAAGNLEHRMLPSGRQSFIKVADASTTELPEKQHNYFAVALRNGGGTKEDITEIPCVFVDVDYKDIPTEAEIARLEAAIKAQEADRDAKSGALAQEAISSDELSAKGLVDRILTQKSVEGSLNQMRDSVAKLAAAVIEAGRTLRKLRSEEDRLGADLVVLEHQKKFEAAQKHFKSFVSSWEDAERDHAEFVRLLMELRDVGVDMKMMGKAAGLSDDALFAVVASGTFVFSRHTLPDFALEMGSKRAIPGNPFYKGDTARVQMGKSDFRKSHAFNGCFFSK